MKKTKKPVVTAPAMSVCNNTSFALEEIRTFPYLGNTINKWRGRYVQLYAHPTDEDQLVSVGTTLDGTRMIICSEPRSAWATALDYARHGKMYVSE